MITDLVLDDPVGVYPLDVGYLIVTLGHVNYVLRTDICVLPSCYFLFLVENQYQSAYGESKSS
jgi:hypothetical protein